MTSITTAYLKGGNGNNRLDASSFNGDMTLIGMGGGDTKLDDASEVDENFAEWVDAV